MQAPAREFAQDEIAHVAWAKDAMKHAARSYQPNDEHPGDPTKEQSR